MPGDIRTNSIRTCCICGVRAEKKLLTRMANLGGVITIDDTGRTLGRGAYLCDGESSDSIGRSIDKIARALRMEILSDNWKSSLPFIGNQE